MMEIPSVYVDELDRMVSERDELYTVLAAFVAGWDDEMLAIFSTAPDELRVIAPTCVGATLGLVRRAAALIRRVRDGDVPVRGSIPVTRGMWPEGSRE